MATLPLDYDQYLSRRLKQNIGKQVCLYGKPLGILSNSEIHYFPDSTTPLIIYVHLTDGSFRRLTHKEVPHITFDEPAFRFFTTTGNIFKDSSSPSIPNDGKEYIIKPKDNPMNLLSLATRISSSNDTSNPAVSIEIILAAITLILQNCPMNRSDLIARSKNPGLLDRVRLRRALVTVGASPEQIQTITRNFFTVIGQETEATLLNALEELQA